MTAETPQRGLTAEQLNMLLTPLNPNRVKEHKGNAHLEAWDVRRWLTRIFGFAGWGDEILSMECIHSVTSPIGNDPAPLKHRCTAVYRVTMRLTVKDQWGNVLGHWDDGATGEGINQVSVGDAHDLALKAALSQALKRCAVNLCDQFGLSLYNKGDMRGVVVRTLGHPVLTAPAEVPEDAPVLGGELDEQREAAAAAGPQHQVADAVVRKEKEQRQQRQMVDLAPRDPVNPFDPDFALPPALGSASARPATDAQLAKLAILVGEKRGVSGSSKEAKAARLGILGALIGREITTGRDLTLREASDLIEQLTLAPPAGQPATAAPASGSDPDQIEADLQAAIESAESPQALEDAYGRAEQAAAAGSIGRAALGPLGVATKRRRDELAADNGWSHRVLAAQSGVAV